MKQQKVKAHRRNKFDLWIKWIRGETDMVTQENTRREGVKQQYLARRKGLYGHEWKLFNVADLVGKPKRKGWVILKGVNKNRLWWQLWKPIMVDEAWYYKGTLRKLSNWSVGSNQ